MQFAQPLVPGRLIRRYKRFLADVTLDDGAMVTAHCPNPGAMLGVAEPGMRVWVEPTPGRGRKLSHAWRLVELAGGHMAGIDTGVPNRVAGEALREGRVPGLEPYTQVRAEVPYGRNSRVDFLLSADGLPDAYVEVKNVHMMREPGLAEFPDCVTARGTKHLDELATMVGAGHRAVMLYVLQRTDCDRLALARDIDPAYGAAFDRAVGAGVEAIAMGCTIAPGGIALDRSARVTEV